MFTHIIKISSDETVNYLQNYKEPINDYIFNLFNKQVIEPNYYLGYITELLEVNFQEYNQDSKNIITYLSYRLHEDKEFKLCQERLKIGI